MAASETHGTPKDEASQPKPAAESDNRPCGTMFDPETIRKFLEQIKKEDQ